MGILDDTPFALSGLHSSSSRSRFFGDFLAEVRKDLLYDPETGIMSLIDSIEAEIVDAMAAAKTPS